MQTNWNQIIHWAGQIIPPLTLVMVFSTHGPGYWFLLSIPLFCVFISLITLMIRLLDLKKNKRIILRPILTIFISGSLFSLAIHSYSVAETQADEIYEHISSQCKNHQACVNALDRWEEVEANKTYRIKVGNFVTYPLTCYIIENGFRLYLYQSLDLGKSYEGNQKW